MRWVDWSTMAQNKTTHAWSDSAEGILTLTATGSWKNSRTHTASRSLILTKTLKAFKSRTPKGTKTQRIQGHLKLTEWFVSELTQCDRSICLKEICYIHPCQYTLIVSYPIKRRWEKKTTQKMEQTNIILKSTLDSITNNFIQFAYLCVCEKKKRSRAKFQRASQQVHVDINLFLSAF